MVRVLVVDDASAFRSQFDGLGGEMAVDAFGSAAEVEAAMAKGVRWDVAFVDFNLGTGEPSGLAVFELLHALGAEAPRTVVYSQFGELGGRLLFAAAGKRWFDVQAAVDKDYERLLPRGRTMVSYLRDVIRRVMDGQDPTPEPKRSQIAEAARLVDQLLRNHQDLDRWRALIQFQDQTAVLSSLKGSPAGRKAALYAWYRDVEAPRVAFESLLDGGAGALQADASTRENRAVFSPNKDFVRLNQFFFNAPELRDALTIGMARAKREKRR